MALATSNVGYSLAAAVSWGAGDFGGGQAAKKGSVFGVVVLVEGVGLVFMLSLALFKAEPIPAARGLLWAIVAGLVNSAGLVCFYRALAVGKMGPNASLAGLLATSIPVVIGALTQGWPRLLQLLGFGLGLLSIALVSLSDSLDGRTRGLSLAFLAGCCFGGFLVFSKLAGELGLFWILAIIRAASLLLILCVAGVSRVEWAPKREQLFVSCLAGVFDGLGNLFYVLATQSGRLDVSAVLSSLYSAVTVVLAFIFLGERVGWLQGAGIVAALAAILLLAHS
jgi:drug/metabolite transporter (DMT)-like permease